MIELDDNDAKATKTEGKKLKSHGAHLARLKGYLLDDQLEIEKDSPAILETEIELDEEYAVGNIKESKLEREERLKREAEIAQRTQVDKQQQRENKNPNREIEQNDRGIALSQNKGIPTTEVKHKKTRAEGHTSEAEMVKEQQREEKRDDSKLIRTDMSVASFVLGDNAKNLNFSDDVKLAEKGKPPAGSIAATKVEDIRSKTGKGLELV